MTSLMRREPSGEVQSLRQAMDRLFEDSVVRSPRSSTLAPALDMYETENDFVIKFEVAGVDPEDIEVRMVGNALTIKGEVKAENESEDRYYIWRERRAGQFVRTLEMPQNADSNKVEAEFENGVLTLTVAKREETKPKSVEIKVK